MKKFLKLFCLIALMFLMAGGAYLFASEDKTEGGKWTKLDEGVYIDKSSITKNRDLVSGWFKLYNSPERELHSINNIDVEYEIVKYEVQCSGIIAISIAETKSYDKNNNLLDEYINAHGYACTYPCLVNDEIYIKELCN